MYKLPKFFEHQLMIETRLPKNQRPKKEEKKEKRQKIRKSKPAKEKVQGEE